MKAKYQEEKNTIIRELIAIGVPENQAEIVGDCFAVADAWGGNITWYQDSTFTY